MVTIRSVSGMKLERMFRNVVLPAPVPPEIRMLILRFHRGGQNLHHLGGDAFEFHQGFRRDRPAAEAPDGHAGAVEGQRRNDGVHARAVRKPGIHHGRGFIHPAAHARHDAIDHLHQVPVVPKFRAGPLQDSMAFHIDHVSVVDQNVRYGGIFQQGFQRSQPEDFVQKLAFDPLFFRAVQRHSLGADNLLNHGADRAAGPGVVDRREFFEVDPG